MSERTECAPTNERTRRVEHVRRVRSHFCAIRDYCRRVVRSFSPLSRLSPKSRDIIDFLLLLRTYSSALAIKGRFSLQWAHTFLCYLVMDLMVFRVSELCKFIFIYLIDLRNGSARLGPARPPGGPVPAGGSAGIPILRIRKAWET